MPWWFCFRIFMKLSDKSLQTLSWLQSDASQPRLVTLKKKHSLKHVSFLIIHFYFICESMWVCVGVPERSTLANSQPGVVVSALFWIHRRGSSTSSWLVNFGRCSKLLRKSYTAACQRKVTTTLLTHIRVIRVGGTTLTLRLVISTVRVAFPQTQKASTWAVVTAGYRYRKYSHVFTSTNCA